MDLIISLLCIAVNMIQITVTWFGLLVLWCICTGMAEEGEYMKYKDHNQPVAIRVQDLLTRMTLQEKIGQMVQIDRIAATADIMQKYHIGNGNLLFFQFSIYLMTIRAVTSNKFLLVPLTSRYILNIHCLRAFIVSVQILSIIILDLVPRCICSSHF